jgi:DNA repair protein RecO (recombination protein O)
MSSRERSFRSEAIILKRRDFGEADRLLTVLTPRKGRLEVIAKGARKPASSKTGHVELFTKADMLIHKGRDLGIVVQAEVIDPLLPLREDLQRGAYANYVAELIDRFTASGDSDDMGGLYTLLDATLQRLCSEDDLQLVVRYFEMRLLDEVGFRPELNECVISREKVEAEDQYFSVSQGGVVRPSYVSQSASFMAVPMVTLKVMRHMQRSSFEHVRSLTVSPLLHADLERIMLAYVTFILEQKLQSVDFIQRIRSTT